MAKTAKTVKTAVPPAPPPSGERFDPHHWARMYLANADAHERNSLAGADWSESIADDCLLRTNVLLLRLVDELKKVRMVPIYFGLSSELVGVLKAVHMVAANDGGEDVYGGVTSPREKKKPKGKNRAAHHNKRRQ